VPVLVPLFVSLFRRADVLATAMEARCYRGGKGRTRLHESHMRRADWVTLGAGVALLAAIVLAA
jgi:energy-coupling factor transport system permease protein